MRVVHKATDARDEEMPEGLRERAKYLETKGDLKSAAREYEKVIRETPLYESAYHRLMIIYRKEKEYRKEAAIIRKGIRSFEKLYDSRQTRSGRSRKVQELSKALLKSTGLADRKGKPFYEPEPLGKWRKRLALVEKRYKV